MASTPATLTVESLRTGHVDTPLIVHRQRPRLSWALAAGDVKRLKQAAYRILAASTPDALANDKADLWDSRRVETDETLIHYDGKPLASRARCFWKVAVWHNLGAVETWSDIARFEMGLLAPADWSAKWIESPDASCRSPLFRRQFELPNPPANARIYLCGLGYSELYINGMRVSDRVLDPAQTDYETRCLYVGHDVTSFLKQGANVIGVMLGNGFYTQDRVWGGMSYGRPKMILQLHVDDEAPIVSDGTWKTAAGPVIEDNVYAGETYDARKEIAGWNDMTGDESKWASAVETASPTKTLQPHLLPPMRATRLIEPVKISKVGEVHIIDLGENFAGWTKLSVQNAPSTPIRLRSAEELHADGTLDTASTGVFATNVEQIDTYIPKGSASETWEPRFTYHGFRYVEISGLKNEPTNDTLKGVAVHTDLEPIGTFECSDPIINRIYATAIRTLTSNIHSIPTDCPAREKCGWLGDAHIASEFALCAFDASPLYDKYLQDIETTWRGELPGDVAPGKRCSNPGGHLDWGLALIFLPWHVYLYRGDETILRDHYTSMRRFLQAGMEQAKEGVLSFGYGDWCPPGSVEPMETPPALTTTALFAHASRLMTRVAKLLGHADDAATFGAFARRSVEAFNGKYFQPATKRYGSQCADAMALELDLCPADHRAAVARALNIDVIQTHATHHTTGIFGTRWLYPALAGNGFGPATLALLRQTTYPSIGDLFSRGATTFWECWGEKEIDAKWGARSHNHVMQTAFAAWFYHGLAGINATADAPGFKHVLLCPQFVADEKLSSVKATHRSRHGTIVSGWKVDGKKVNWRVEIPPNTTATVRLADRADQEIGSGGYDFEIPLAT